jgi:transcription-repair coupling factor (superfamily II helicase)
VVQELRAARKGEAAPPDPLGSIRIDLPIPVRLPEDYVTDVGLRLKMYRRLANLNSMVQIDDMSQELVDRFGPLPPPAQNLMYQLRLKALARDAGVSTITVENGRLALRSGQVNYADRDGLRRILGQHVTVSHRDVWLRLERGWRGELVGVLKKMTERTV